jgi:glycosyltransferase involved in cell wall biosynthesis
LAVEAIVGQVYPGEIEILVVFDGPQAEVAVVTGPDRTLGVMTNRRTPGPAGARNTGMFAASGELVALCDDDDIWLPDKLSLQVEALEAHPEAEIVGCGVTLVAGESETIRVPSDTWVDHSHLLARRHLTVNNSTVLMRRTLVEELGGFDEAIPGSYGEDYDLFLRASARHPILLVGRPLVRLLWGPTSYFAERWETIGAALRYLLAKHPGIGRSGRGYGRVAGQIAFAAAAGDDRAEALRWALRALRRSPLERRAFVTLAVAARVVSASRVITWANRRGRGI